MSGADREPEDGPRTSENKIIHKPKNGCVQDTQAEHGELTMVAVEEEVLNANGEDAGQQEEGQAGPEADKLHAGEGAFNPMYANCRKSRIASYPGTSNTERGVMSASRDVAEN